MAGPPFFACFFTLGPPRCSVRHGPPSPVIPDEHCACATITAHLVPGERPRDLHLKRTALHPRRFLKRATLHTLPLRCSIYRCPETHQHLPIAPPQCPVPRVWCISALRFYRETSSFRTLCASERLRPPPPSTSFPHPQCRRTVLLSFPSCLCPWCGGVPRRIEACMMKQTRLMI